MKHVKMFGKSIPLIAIVLACILTIGGVSATLLTYYNSIGGLVHVQQAVLVDDEGIGTPIVEEFGSVTGGDIVCTTHTLENLAVIPAPVSFEPIGNDDGITVKYLKPVEVSYSETWVGDGGESVLVTITETPNWLTWLYTAVETPTAGELKMTLEIDSRDFLVTTFDDGSHPGWWYMADGEEPIPQAEWPSYISDVIEVGGTSDSLFVSIKKSVFCCDTEIVWHGYANFHLQQNWIELDKGTTPWAPTGNVELAEDITTSGVTLAPGELFEFVICYHFPLPVAGDYTITTNVNVA